MTHIFGSSRGPSNLYVLLRPIAACSLCLVPLLVAAESPNASFQKKDLVAAVNRAVAPLQEGAAGASKQRTCFTCHSQALPVMALKEAGELGVDFDEDLFESQVKHTVAHLRRGQSNYKKGKGQGGQVLTAGYALWTLEAGDYEPDEITAPVIHYLLERQKEQAYWSRKSKRPPTAGSDFANTYLAMRAFQHFGQPEHQPRIAQRTAAVGKWWLKSKPADTEDRVFHLRLAEYLDVDDHSRRQAVKELLATQKQDGGWSQKDEMESDAYATATALVALLRVGESPQNDAIRHGIQFLLDHQLDDGTWHVVTRAEGFQKYFESGFPHGKDQFISTAATGWAVIALCLAAKES